MQQHLDIIYQDEYIVAIDKPANLIVHPGQGGVRDEPSAMKMLKAQIKKWVYPIHRLDRPTSGVLLFGLTKEITAEISKSWDQVDKKYYALVCGHFTIEGKFDFPLKEDDKINRDTGEKYTVYQDALTLYRPIKSFQGKCCQFTFCEIDLKTGRRHQIRRHFARGVTPVAGDTKYGKAKFNNDLRDNFNMKRIFLHCHSLKLTHPITGKSLLFHSPLPKELQMSELSL